MRVPLDRRVADLFEMNNIERFRARRLAVQRRRAAQVRKGATASQGGATERSLPSGPAPQPARDMAIWVGFLALAAGLMAFRQIRNRWWGIRDEIHD